MVQKKAHKSKPKSQQARFKPKDGKEFNAQLEALGLRIDQITADGNCLFRAVADQLEGNEEEHSKYRKMVVDYIEAHREDYEPFLEDDVTFDDYCKNMREESTWAGHMELQVISLVTHTNICIHRLSSPRWHIHNFESTKARGIHLSYHNGEHYNSVRRKDDSGGGPAKSIMLETPVMEEKKDGKGKAAQKKCSSNNSTTKQAQLAAAEEQTFEEVDDDGINCNESGLQLDFDASTISTGFQSIEDVHTENEGDMSSSKPSQQAQDFDAPTISTGFQSTEDVHTENEGDMSSSKPSQQAQEVARNKACPCGSKKKYKACCGAVTPIHKAQEKAWSSSIEGLSNKARKQKLRNNKGVSKEESESVIAKDPPDMGYLCI